MAATSVSVVSTYTQKAQEVKSFIENGFKLNEAQVKSKEIYQEGKAQIANAVLDRLHPEPFTSITVTLGQAFSAQSEVLQHHLYLRHLTKVYRVFAELSWYQCWIRKQQPTFPETVETMRTNAAKILSVVSAEPRIEVKEGEEKLICGIRTIFEAKCLQEAAKLFSPSDGIWGKYLFHAERSISAAVEVATSFTFSNLLESLTALFKDVKNDLVSGWYLDVWRVRWSATTVHTLPDFEKNIRPIVEEFMKQGEERSICLVVIFMDFLKRGDVDMQVKALAFSYLKQLLCQENSVTIGNLVDNLPSTNAHELALRMDKCWASRRLAMQCLQVLATKPKYEQWKSASLDALKRRLTEIQGAKSKRYAKEKSELTARMAPHMPRLKQLADVVGMLGGGQMGGPTFDTQKLLKTVGIKTVKEVESEFIPLNTMYKNKKAIEASYTAIVQSEEKMLKAYIGRS